MDANCSVFTSNFLKPVGSTAIELVQEAIGEQMYQCLNIELYNNEARCRLFDDKIYFIQMNLAVEIFNSGFHRDHY